MNDTDMKERIIRLEVALVRIAEQRDELLEALEEAMKAVRFENHPFRPWHQKARAAITKATPK